MSEKILYDSHGRRIDYIRISITDRCNFRCAYCMPEEGQDFIPHAEILSYEEILRLCRIFADLGIGYYKITGGEPLCRKGAIDFIRDLRAIPGVLETTLTTNGSLLGKYAIDLANIGVEAINVSLDALDQLTFTRLSRSNLSLALVLDGIAAAKARGLRLKINTVPIAKENEDQLVPLVEYAAKNGFPIRFIELMPMGEGNLLKGMPLWIVRRKVEEHFGKLLPVTEKMGNGPALCYHVNGVVVGFIGAMTEKFCATCNRVRLTSAGYLKTCLHHNVGIDLKTPMRLGASDQDITGLIMDAVRRKPLAHNFAFHEIKDGADEVYMNSVGG